MCMYSWSQKWMYLWCRWRSGNETWNTQSGKLKLVSTIRLLLCFILFLCKRTSLISFWLHYVLLAVHLNLCPCSFGEDVTEQWTREWRRYWDFEWYTFRWNSFKASRDWLLLLESQPSHYYLERKREWWENFLSDSWIKDCKPWQRGKWIKQSYSFLLVVF